MSRYNREPLIPFTDSSGNSFELRRPQEIQAIEYRFAGNIDIENDDELDQIAQRQSIYGERAEMLWFQIFDYNLVRIVENGFSLRNLKNIKIPKR